LLSGKKRSPRELIWSGEEELATLVYPVDAPSRERLVESGFERDRISEKNNDWTSNGNGTDASPSSRTRSIGSGRRVIPILTMFGPSAPRLLIM
jgi:hypothetical protein